MPPTPNATAQRPMLGILFMLAACSLFPVMNGLVQVLSARYASPQLIWVRNLSHLLFALALFLPKFGPGILRTTQPGAQLIRSILMLGSTTLFFFGVKHLHLTQAAAITFTSPFIVTMLAIPLLGERVSPARLAAVLVAFLGVLVVIRPGSAVFQPASFLIIGSSTCYALYQIVTRRVAGYDRPETSAIYAVLVGTLVMSFVAPFVWRLPDSMMDAVLMASLGVLGGGGHYFVARAMTYAPANLVAPFGYWQMLGSVIVGYFVSGRLPDAFTWAGSSVIIGAGLYIWWRETRERSASS